MVSVVELALLQNHYIRLAVGVDASAASAAHSSPPLPNVQTLWVPTDLETS